MKTILSRGSRPWAAPTGALLLASLLLGACSFHPTRLFTTYTDIEVREVGRSLYCNTPGETAAVQLLPDTQAVLAWEASRGVTLAGAESVVQAPYAVVEMGARPTGGYGLAVARAAALRGETLILKATFVSPPPGSLRTQALSSPCVLVQLPRGRYVSVEVQDQTGTVQAHGGLEAPAPPEAPAPVETKPETAPEPAAEPAPEPVPEPAPAANPPAQ